MWRERWEEGINVQYCYIQKRKKHIGRNKSQKEMQKTHADVKRLCGKSLGSRSLLLNICQPYEALHMVLQDGFSPLIPRS